MRLQRGGNDSNGSDENMDLWQRLRKYGSKSCDNTVVERNWLGCRVININGSGKTATTVEARTRLIGPSGSGSREGEAT